MPNTTPYSRAIWHLADRAGTLLQHPGAGPAYAACFSMTLCLFPHLRAADLNDDILRELDRRRKTSEALHAF